MESKLTKLNKEDFIWLIYIFIAVFAIVSNYYERKYVISKNKYYKNIYKKINIILLSIGLLIYLYFVIINYEDIKNSKYGYLKEFASVMFLIGGALLLYIEYNNSTDIEEGII